MRPIGGDFVLTDHFGRRASLADYRGRFPLIFFGFSHCRVICPRALTRLSAALDRLGPSSTAVHPLYITVDPERDTPAVLKSFLEAGFPRFLGLTGSREEIDIVKANYRVFARRAGDAVDQQGYAIAHTAFSYFIDPEGQYLTHFTDAIEEGVLAQELQRWIARYPQR